MNKGFTLAEVLITLAIIGVVAAMTVPTLMTSTRGKEYEVAANKALSTISNAMQMRYAMDGQTLADYYGKYGHFGINYQHYYLTKPPGYDPKTNIDSSRPGEQPALTTTVSPRFGSGWSVYKLKDGMMIINASYTTYSSAPENNCMILVMDTNGEKGPTRSNLDTNSACSSGSSGKDVFSMSCKLNNQTVTLSEADTSNNKYPDIVVFQIDANSGSVKPVGQRTRNIMATGNAMISQ